MIDRKTQIYGIIGYPLGHTLSPAMHNAAFRATGLNAVYLSFETRDLSGALAGVRALGIQGMSVTLPHKTAVISLLDGVDDLAKKIGAVNTIINKEGRLIGTNTDALGAFRALEEKTKLNGKTGILVGAGGAARAIGYLLKEQGVRLTLSNRSRERGEALADFLNCPFLPLEEIGKAESDLLVQTTPVGMAPHEDRCLIEPKNLKKGMIVMDVIYNPLETRLIRMARERGSTPINGLSMFIHQGAEQFRQWTGLHPPLSEMTEAVKAGLREFL